MGKIGPEKCVAAAAAAEFAASTVVFPGVISKPPSDTRAYRSLSLANGLEVLIVTDPAAEVAAAALDVHVGHYSDPPSLPGLAHFTEHMMVSPPYLAEREKEGSSLALPCEVLPSSLLTYDTIVAPNLRHSPPLLQFLGNAAFPQEGSFSTFLSSNGGSSNAFTDNEDTVYFFDMTLPSSPNDSLPFLSAASSSARDAAAEVAFLGADGGLNRFASFFVSPSFTPSGAAREINAVDSEHRKNLQQDVWRLGQLEKATRANPDHPTFKFGTGYKDTLTRNASNVSPFGVGDELRAALLIFWRRYYIAPMMTLSVVSRLPVEKVQAAVESYFGEVPRVSRSGDETNPLSLVLKPYNVRPEAEWMELGIPAYHSTFRSSILAKRPETFAVLTKPIAPVRSLKIEWHLQRPNPYIDVLSSAGGADDGDSPVLANAREVLGKPAQIVSNLVGHEGRGSLLQFLKRAGLANSLSSGAAYESTDVQTLEVTIDLTPRGLQAWEDVAALVFGYIKLLQFSEVPAYFIDECVSLANLSWRFSERSEPPRYAPSLAENMQALRQGVLTPTAIQGGPPGKPVSPGEPKVPTPSVLGPARYLDGNRLFLQPDGSLATSASLGPLVANFASKLDPRAASIMLVAPEVQITAVL